MIDKSLALCIETIQAFEEAAEYLMAGNERKAKTLIIMLSESVYNLGLSWYSRCKQDYLYFLARFVLESIEPQSIYTVKDGRNEDLAEYKAGLLSPATIKPRKVTVNQKPVEIDWSQLIEEPLEAA